MPTFLTEPQWYDKNGDLTSAEKIKVDNATHADDYSGHRQSVKQRCC